MIDTRKPGRLSKTFSRSYVAPALQVHLDSGGTVEEWLAGRTPIASMARISADRLTGDAIGVGRQHRNNTRNAELRNCAVVVHYEDNNLTAAKQEVRRPAFLQMVKDITHRHEEETGIPILGCIAVERERVFRLPRDYIALQDAFFLAGGGIFIEDTQVLDLANNNGASISSFENPETEETEVKKIRSRTARNAADRAEEGRVFGGPRRFGWLSTSKEPYRLGNKHRNDEEWPHLIKMVKMRYRGTSWRSISAEMNRKGVKTARGGMWSEQGVKGVVTNPAWWGGRVLNGELVTDEETGETKIGEWDHARKEDECTYEMWKSIMAGVIAKRLHRGMKSDTETRQPAENLRSRTYLFSGILRCGRINDLGDVCHAKLSGNKATGRNAKYGDYYRCGSPNCKGVARRIAPVDTHLEELVLAYLDKNFSGTKAQMTPWRGAGKLATLHRQRKGIKDSVANGEVGWADVHDILARLERNITMLEQEEQEHLKAEVNRNLLRGWSREKWGTMELADKREVIAQALTSVTVKPIPEGVSDKSPFNPELLNVSWRNKNAEHQGSDQVA